MLLITYFVARGTQVKVIFNLRSVALADDGMGAAFITSMFGMDHEMVSCRGSRVVGGGFN